MTLKEYLEYTGITGVNFAKKLGVSYAYFLKIASGTDVRLSMAIRIETLTMRKVTCRELYKGVVREKSYTGFKMNNIKKDITVPRVFGDEPDANNLEVI